MRISLNVTRAAAIAVAALFSWAGTASATDFYFFGDWRQQRGQAEIPLRLDDRAFKAGIKNIVGAQATQMGSSPASLKVDPNSFEDAAFFQVVSGLPTNATVVQVATQLNLKGPRPTYGVGSGTLRAGGPTGTVRPTNNFQFCPADFVAHPTLKTACPSVDAGQAKGGFNGRVTYTAGTNVFGGVMQMGISGVGVVTNELPTAAFPPVTGTGAGCPNRDHGGKCPAVVNLPFGGAGAQAPGGQFSFTSSDMLSGNQAYQLKQTGACPFVGTGCILNLALVTPISTLPASTNKNVGFYWTTGTVMVSATKGPTEMSLDTTYTQSGTDRRTAQGSGQITLVAGAVTKRGSGATYASLDRVKMALVATPNMIAAPSMAPVGIAAFMGLLALAGGYRLRRNSRKD